MALKTLGTAATNTLSAVQWNAAMNVQDLAALNALIKEQGSRATTTIQPIPSVSQGMLYYPNRGSLKLFEGDWIAVDPNTGFVFVINAATAAAASWVHS